MDICALVSELFPFATEISSNFIDLKLYFSLYPDIDYWLLIVLILCDAYFSPSLIIFNFKKSFEI